jgi:ABC-2 type transport system ATP-binding protein
MSSDGRPVYEDMTPTLAIDASGLVKSFGDTRAVDGVDLAVPLGAVYGVLGPNGAGKTTTIRMLATLVRPDSGTARVLGHDIVTEADAVRGLISLTGQLASVDDDLTGRENLVLLGRLLGYGSKQARSRAEELLTAFGLDDAAGRLVKTYSGGMRRRLDIAASIVVTPDLMFLDEPTTGLDPRSRNQVWDIIRALVGQGTTVLLCTQYLDEADQLADRIAVIDRGRVIAEGTPGRLKASVGEGALHVRLLDPARRDDAVRLVARMLDVDVTSTPTRPPVRPRAGRRAGLGGRGRALPREPRPGRLRAGPAEPRRGVPGPDRPHDRGGRRGMSDAPTMRAAPEPVIDDRLRTALARTPRPPRPGAAAAALAFGWRGMLKIRHVPEQLLDVTITPVPVPAHVHVPVRRRGRGVDRGVPAVHPARRPRPVRLFTSVYSGVALNTDVTKGVVDRFRSLPIWRPAPLVGAVLGDSVRYVLAATVVVLLGLLMGFRAAAGVTGVVGAMALVVVFSFGLSWVFTTSASSCARRAPC